MTTAPAFGRSRVDTTVNEGDTTNNYAISLSETFGAGESVSIVIEFSDNTTSANDIGSVADNRAETYAAIRNVVTTRSDLTFDETTGTLTFTAATDGDAMADVEFAVVTREDAVVEADESFTISLSAPSTTTGASVDLDASNRSVQTTIVNDDFASVSITDRTTSEDGTMVFTAVLDTAVEGGFEVDVNYIGNTATAGSDFDDALQTLTFDGNIGESVQFTVPLSDDTTIESEEDFTVSMTNVVTAVVQVGSINVSDTATGTIIDNDSAAVTIEDVVVNEDGTLTFAATLSHEVDGGIRCKRRIQRRNRIEQRLQQYNANTQLLGYRRRNCVVYSADQ